MDARQQHEYAVHSEGLRGYAAIENKIIFVIGVDLFVEKHTGKRYYTARYFFIDDEERHIFKTDTSLVTKVNSDVAKILYESSGPTIQRNTKRHASR